jgi:hypothetical protein
MVFSLFGGIGRRDRLKIYFFSAGSSPAKDKEND